MPVLYMIHPSPPSRAVLMTAKAIGLDLEIKEVDFFSEEHLKAPFLEMNPQHTLPTLKDDDGFTIWDSHAIMIYLVSKYAKDDSLYPTDLRKRAVVDQRLHFESGVVFAVLRRTFRPIVLAGETNIEQKNIDGILEGYDFLNSFLKGKKWVAGDSITIADFSLISSVGTLRHIVPIDKAKFPRVIEWLQQCEQLPEFKVNRKGEKEMSDIVLSKLKK